MALVLLFAALLLLVGLGFPVLLAIGLVGLVGIVTTPELVPALFAQKAFAIVDSFSLLALPYFILAGSLMTKGGLSKVMVDFGQSLVGHVRGSLGHTGVIACMGMANVSGSSAAEAAAIGSVVIPSMKERGYRPGLAASIIGTAATIGPVIPPSMTMIVYGSMTGTSIGGLFLAGILPGLLLGLGLMTVIYTMSYLPGFPELRQVEPRQSLRQILRATRRAWVALLAPVIILGGIFSGVFTATEAGVVACLYAFLVSYLVYRAITLADLPAILLDAAMTTAMVVGIIAMAGPLGYLLSFLDFNELVMALIRSLSQDPTVVILTLLATMIVLTMFIESLAVLIILVPVAAYVGEAFGFDPLHLGVMMVLATQIGATTPPVAVLLFVATSVAKAKFTETVRYCAPFILTLVAILLLIAFVPAIPTMIPSLALGR